MRFFIILFFTLCWQGLTAQSDFILFADSIHEFKLMVDGNEYDYDKAKIIKISGIPEDALVSFTMVVLGDKQKVVAERIQFEDNAEYVYQVYFPKKGTKGELMFLEAVEKDDGFEAMDMGDNWVEFAFGDTRVLERFKGEAYGSSSATMKRTKSEEDSFYVDENGNKVKVQIKKKGKEKSKEKTTVFHQESTKRHEKDARDNTMLKPRNEGCAGPWSEDEAIEGLKWYKDEISEHGRLYVGKKLSVDYCYPTADLITMLKGMQEDATKIMLAKFAYPSLTDPDNFEQIKDTFEEERSYDAVEIYVDIKYKD